MTNSNCKDVYIYDIISPRCKKVKMYKNILECKISNVYK